MTTQSYHVPVMPEPVLNHWLGDKNGIYIDGTLGAGGHSKMLLEKLSARAILFGIDQDDEAHKEARANIGEDERFKPVKGNFGYMETLLGPEYNNRIDGILLDLGVSSHQIDEASRGFSFQNDGPLDMRMGNLQGITASDVVNEYSYQKLRGIIWQYGEEKQSGRISNAIIDARPLSTTLELRNAIAKVVPSRFLVKSLARVFQAIRIEVNRELEVLKQGLEQGTRLLKPNGHFVVLSYHSLEDRLIKNYFRSGNFDGKLEKDFYGQTIRPLEPINNRVITATEAEIQANSRSRSAKLRIAKKLEVSK